MFINEVQINRNSSIGEIKLLRADTMKELVDYVYKRLGEVEECVSDWVYKNSKSELLNNNTYHHYAPNCDIVWTIFTDVPNVNVKSIEELESKLK